MSYRFKKCPQCGWEYPVDTLKHHCRFCGHLLPSLMDDGTLKLCRRCVTCGREIPADSGYLQCNICRNAASRLKYATNEIVRDKQHQCTARLSKQYTDTITKQYADWRDRLRLIKMHTLTEAEWLKACEYFNGCAWCGVDDIAARQYFIAFKHGGMYNACNVLPACEKCATKLNKVPNSFYRFNSIYMKSTRSIRLPRENLQRIVDYLQERMKENE